MLMSAANCLNRCVPALGTYVKLALEGDAGDAALLRVSVAAFEELRRVEALLNFHDPASELSEVNRNALHRPVSISPELAQVLALSLRLSRLTDGLFDPTIASAMVQKGALSYHGEPAPASGNWQAIQLEGLQLRFSEPVLIDLGGIAKGFAVDCAFATVPQELAVVVEAGGDLRMRPWRDQFVGVRTPSGAAPFVPVAMVAEAVATSGAYYNDGVHRVFDPATAEPVAAHKSISVFADSCMLADALTKVGLLLPDDGFFQRQAAAAMILDQRTGDMVWVGGGAHG